MHVAPWAEEPVAAELPGILQRLRGEWPCVPFGYAVTDPTAPAEWARLNGPAEPGEEVHGHGSNHPWTWEESDGDEPEALHRLSRRQPGEAPGPNHYAGPERARRRHRAPHRDQGRLPPAARPASDLPPPGRDRALPASNPRPSREGRTYPGTVEPSAPLFAIDRAFASLNAVPGRDGGSIDASRLPFAQRHRRAAAAQRHRRQRRARQRGRGLSRAAHLAEGAFPEPPALDLQPRPQGRRPGTAGIWRSAWSRSARPSASVPPSPAPTIRWRRPARPRLATSPPAKSSPPAIASKPKRSRETR